jgi:hypothetical protein
VGTARTTPSGDAAATVAAVGVGALVALLLGVYGRQHPPSGRAITLLGFDTMFSMKVTLAFVAAGLALVQLVTALWMYGRLGLRAPAWLGPVHRSTGVLAVLVTVPVAYHCLWSLGFQTFDTRVLVHSVAGCLLYGVLAAKVVAVHWSHSGWLLPLAGGLLFLVLAATVLTSALWYVTSTGATYG